MQQNEVTIRSAEPQDQRAVAALHTVNWQDAYRGLMPGDYLDGPLAAEMQAAWAGKFADMAEGRSCVLVAEREGRLLGFIRIVPNADPRWGHYIDNLHVAASTRGTGLGRRLFDAGADWAVERGGNRGLICSSMPTTALHGPPTPAGGAGKWRRSWTTRPTAAKSRRCGWRGTWCAEGLRLRLLINGPINN